MKWPLFLVLTLAQVLIISANRRGHGPRPSFYTRDEDYDDKESAEPDDNEDYDQSPEQTSNHRHDGSDREENQVVNAFGNEEEDEEYDDEVDDEDQSEEGPEDAQHDVEEQDEDEHPEEETPNWDAEPAEEEEHEESPTGQEGFFGGNHLKKHAAVQKKRQSDETEIVPRTNWGAEPAKKEYPLGLPVQHVWFTYSTDHSTPCRSFKQCARAVLDMQSKCLISSHLTDIPFNFLIGGDGRVYVGRGWSVQPPASSLEPVIGGNRLDIAFLGNLTRETMTEKMKRAVRSLVDYGVAHDYLSPTYSYKEWDSSGVRSRDTGL